MGQNIGRDGAPNVRRGKERRGSECGWVAKKITFFAVFCFVPIIKKIRGKTDGSAVIP